VSAPPEAAPAGAGAAGASPGTAPPVAVVGFTGRTELWWLHLLKPGFRHCLVALHDGRGWLILDPLAHVTRLAAVPAGAGFDPVAWLLAQGYLPVPVRPAAPTPAAAPWAPYTCVEAVKRVLGIRARFVLTPWQLFRHLTRAEKKVLDSGHVIGI
jgi:hypothetical protein